MSGDLSPGSTTARLRARAMRGAYPLFGRAGAALPLVILAGGLAAGIAVYFDRREAAAVRERFHLKVLAADGAETIRRQFAVYEDALRGGAGLLTVDPAISRARWREFAETVALSRRFHGILGMGVIWPVAVGERDAFVAAVRAGGAPNFRIHAVPGVTPPPGDGTAFVITHIEPLEGNGSAHGLDIASEENRRRAAWASRDTGEAVMTRRIQLVQDGRERPGFLLFMPFYARPASQLATVEERRAAHRGWIYAPMVTDQLMLGALGAVAKDLTLSFFEGQHAVPEARLFDTAGSGGTPPTFAVLNRIALAGEIFTLGWNPKPGFSLGDPEGPGWLGAGIGVIGLVLAGLVHGLRGLGQRAQVLAEQRTAELDRANADLAQVGRLQRSALAELERQKFALDQHAIVMVTDADGTITYANDRLCIISGHAREELAGQNSRIVNSGLHPKEFFQNLHTTIRDGRVWRGEIRNRAKTGKFYWVGTTIVPFFDDLGRPKSFISIGSDITVRRQVTAVLEENEERTRLAVEAAKVGIWEWNLRSNTIHWSEEMFRIYGVAPTRDGIVDYEVWRSAVHPEDLSREEARLQATVARRGTDRREFRIRRHSDGAERFVVAVDRVLVDHHGEPTVTLGTNIDVSENKAAERVRRDMADRLTKLGQQVPGVIFQFRLRTDGTSCLPYASDGIREIYRVTPEDVREDA